MAITANSKTNGYEWRVLLGPTGDWAVPALEFQKDQSGERCEMCGKRIDQGKPYVTNSAGQQPMHISCSGRDEPAVVEGRPAPRRWTHLLLSFVSG